ncbi:hypothetical protein AB0I55_02330 [Actinocatenispora sera]|uniref:Uncharacterized protein n=1 Tax=Actinocatenispora sera TaxID=390989 RepID=A0A810L336_9ACTN|nr:hypothetical protein [Actinocatenispora sera]BCJ29803.1 hypothetical protein Asera_39110 [Actinocatenispora sera]
MPAPVSILIAFGLIAGLAIVLRWTYGSDLTERRYHVSPNDDDPAAPTPLGPPVAAPSVPDGTHEAIEPAAQDQVVDAPESLDEGYGLLRTVLVAENQRQATLVREVLADAGIRSTISTDGNSARVLVFVDQLDKARRLVG